MREAFTVAHRRHLDRLAQLPVWVDEQGMLIGDQRVMFAAEAPLMRRHAESLVAADTPRGRAADVLEIGLGMGVFASQLPRFVGTYTTVEAVPEVVAHTGPLLAGLLGARVRYRVIGAPWQLAELPDSAYDAIMYDTWPPEGYADDDFAVFAEHVAARCLRPGGRWSFFWSGSRLSSQRRSVLDRWFPGWHADSYTMPPELVPRDWTKPTTAFLVPVATRST
ncbi:class I SAM-dependent methyltransferase [Actinomadura harenae]|uniref:Class I SAM-dependent methyltransferase n=1 Tax=Actinomadura harenae TaxID=2483351 RepID=A0A3M2LXD8_9ACTN|nr:class I SAM-dependent methyltransferase [Actinomadura harenae]RMI42101.1 class I SAM-dependent methyltransferase [Actinomadura harenae]